MSHSSPWNRVTETGILGLCKPGCIYPLSPAPQSQDPRAGDGSQHLQPKRRAWKRVRIRHSSCTAQSITRASWRRGCALPLLQARGEFPPSLQTLSLPIETKFLLNNLSSSAGAVSAASQLSCNSGSSKLHLKKSRELLLGGSLA